jgi:hypothetical protein
MENVTMYQPKHLKLWTMPDSYFGASWPGYYVFLGQHRDSDSLARSNFTCGLEAIGGESETVQVVRESHWAVGWVEWIAIHQDDEKALQIADEIKAALEDYPVVNEDHWSELEWNEAQDYWASMSIRERMRLCYDAHISVFAARRDWIPQDDNGYIFDSLRG